MGFLENPRLSLYVAMFLKFFCRNNFFGRSGIVTNGKFMSFATSQLFVQLMLLKMSDFYFV